MPYVGYFDGASRGNPGESGAGAVLFSPEGERLWKAARGLGVRTNNEAEYAALGLLLEEARRRGVKDLVVRGDSKLVVSQMTGAWKVKEPRLQEVVGALRPLLEGMKVSFEWVPREMNGEADGLSNLALDEGDFEEDFGASSQGQLRLDMPEEALRDGFVLAKVGRKCWLVEEGEKQYVLDLDHGVCSCGRYGEGGDCVHMERARKER